MAAGSITVTLNEQFLPRALMTVVGWGGVAVQGGKLAN